MTIRTASEAADHVTVAPTAPHQLGQLSIPDGRSRPYERTGPFRI